MKYILYIIFIFASISSACAQVSGADQKKLKQADHHIYLNSYPQAITILEDVYSRNPEDEHTIFTLARTYQLHRQYPQAERLYNIYQERNFTKEPLALYYFGQVLKTNSKYELARNAFYQFTRLNIPPHYKQYLDVAKQEIKSCEQAYAKLESSASATVKRLSYNVNNPFADFGHWAFGTDTLFYSAIRLDSTHSYEYEGGKQSLSSIYMTERDSTDWKVPTTFLTSIDYHFANPTFNAERNRMYFSQCYQNPHNKTHCELAYIEKENGVWNKTVHLLPSKINLKGHTQTQPTLGTISKTRKKVTTTQRVIYFVSDRRGGFGGLDIWYAPINENGHVGKPLNAGNRINTTFDEVTPFYDNVNQLLYFSSNKAEGIGGFDIYKSKGSEAKWTKPIWIDAPLNSPADDIYFIPPADTSTHSGKGFIVSNRLGATEFLGKGCCDDIFEYEFTKPTEIIIEGTIATADSNQSAGNAKIGLVSIPALMKAKEKGYKKNEIRGIINDIKWVDTTSSDGKFKISASNTPQAIVIHKENHEPEVYVITDSLLTTFSSNTPIKLKKSFVSVAASSIRDTSSTQEIPKNALPIESPSDKTVTTTTKQKDVDHATHIAISERPTSFPEKRDSISIDKIQPNQHFVLEHIYFVFNKEYVKSSSMDELHTLYRFLKDNPTVEIEIQGHTDSKGSHEYNMMLSQKRANTIYRELVRKGISKTRLTQKGYGETVPVAPNELQDGTDNPVGRALNRRSEIIILKK